MNTKIKKLHILKMLTGPCSFLCDKPSTSVVFRNADSTVTISKENVWYPHEIDAFLRANMKEFKHNVFTLAEPFITALQASQKALNNAVYKDPEFMFSHLKYTAGVFIRKEIVVFYKIDTVNYKMTSVAFIEDNLLAGFKDVALHISASNGDEQYKAYVPAYLCFEPDAEDHIAHLRNMCDAPSFIAMFRTFADHEVKVAAGKSSVKLNNQSYNNLNKENIQVVDSTWYTTLLRTSGFMVSGHLRMQPCGKDHSERKLIYIDSFEKHGYVRRAKMLPTENMSYTGVLTS